MADLDATAVTTPARTIIDLSAVWPLSLLHRSIGAALDRSMVTVAELHRTLEPMQRQGRRRTSFIRMALDDPRYGDPKNQSDLEREALKILLAAGLPKPVSQHAVLLERFTLHPDLTYPEFGLAIELDGWNSHGSRFAFHDDRERDALLAIEGWQVVRFSTETVHLLPQTVRSVMNRKKAS